jgi:putative SOS response-associated peptidase YedK
MERIASEFRLQQAVLEMPPSYNIAPSTEIVIVRNCGEKQILTCRWGFVPSWAKGPSGNETINARAETVASKPSFRAAFLKQRCLVVADGFYEWQKIGRQKKPFYVCLRSGKPFGIGGLYSTWGSSGGEMNCSCTIITTAANELLEPIHDRMPLIIPKDKEDLWLDPAVQDQDILSDLLKPYPAEKMELHEVSARVNSPRYDSPDAITPV